MIRYSYHPWRHLAQQWPHVVVKFVDDLPAGKLGETNGYDLIRLKKRQNQRDRRCTLAHELIHVERADYGYCNPLIERDVNREAALRLVTMDDLEAAARWTLNLDLLARELWVTPTILQARFDTMSALDLMRLADAASDSHHDVGHVHQFVTVRSST